MSHEDDSIHKMNETLVSKETVVPCKWKSETLNFGIKEVDKSQISTMRDNEAGISSVSPLLEQMKKS